MVAEQGIPQGATDFRSEQANGAEMPVTTDVYLGSTGYLREMLFESSNEWIGKSCDGCETSMVPLYGSAKWRTSEVGSNGETGTLIVEAPGLTLVGCECGSERSPHVHDADAEQLITVVNEEMDASNLAPVMIESAIFEINNPEHISEMVRLRHE